MLNENMKSLRKKKGVTQEELAARIHVVRQTVSKWESARSVPDADELIALAEFFQVPVSELLGCTVESNSTQELAEELARLNRELAEKNRQENLREQAAKKRNEILFLTFLTMLAMLLFQNDWIRLACVAVGMGACFCVLWRNLALLTQVSTTDLRIPVLRKATGFCASILAAALLIAVLAGQNMLSEMGEKWAALAITSAVLLGGGWLSPKLSFNRHTGLRLPWTVVDEDTWNLAHRIIGFISLPLTLVYWVCAMVFPNWFGPVSGAAVFTWVGIPGLLSLVFYWNKMHGK